MIGVAGNTDQTTGHFVPVKDTEEWEQLVERSRQGPVLLFKHDPYCGISAHAHQELEAVPGDIPLVDVAHQTALSKQVAQETGIRHESPQVILLRDGKPAWSASHWSITASAVRGALSDA